MKQEQLNKLSTIDTLEYYYRRGKLSFDIKFYLIFGILALSVMNYLVNLGDVEWANFIGMVLGITFTIGIIINMIISTIRINKLNEEYTEKVNKIKVDEMIIPEPEDETKPEDETPEPEDEIKPVEENKITKEINGVKIIVENDIFKEKKEVKGMSKKEQKTLEKDLIDCFKKRNIEIEEIKITEGATVYMIKVKE